jgi:uncharacterized protein
MMRIDFFDWDKDNIDHIARHQVDPDEAEEVFDSKYYLSKTWGGRYIALGQTASGRYLTCVFEKGTQPGFVRVVTAREMVERERKLYKRKR